MTLQRWRPPPSSRCPCLAAERGQVSGAKGHLVAREPDGPAGATSGIVAIMQQTPAWPGAGPPPPWLRGDESLGRRRLCTVKQIPSAQGRRHRARTGLPPHPACTQMCAVHTCAHTCLHTRVHTHTHIAPRQLSEHGEQRTGEVQL
jgi:hypothetical protein